MIFFKKTKCWNIVKIIICSLTLVPSVGCSKINYSGKQQYLFTSFDGKPDYSDLHYWAAHPIKWNPSDSIPKSLQKNYIKDTLADVFFIHPTTFVDYDDPRWNATIDDAALNAKTDYSTILYQASAFSEKSRVFSPRYRQANIKAFFTEDTIVANIAFELAYQDIKTAFEYYLKT